MQSPSTKATALCNYHAVGSFLRNLQFRCDRERPVFAVRRGALGNTNRTRIVGKRAAPAREARANGHIDALRKSGVERVDVIFLGLLVTPIVSAPLATVTPTARRLGTDHTRSDALQGSGARGRQ